jgi:hypothetical protein
MRFIDDKRLAAPKWACALLFATLSAGCQSGGIGDPCTPEDEFFPNFNGFAVGEVTVQSRSYECETRVCLVNRFQGRVSCPYGTNGDNPDPSATPTVSHNYPCIVPTFGTHTTVPVRPQLVERPPEVAVYCSCRCAGPDPNARYCECPSGFQCADIGVTNEGQANGQLAGSYCIRSGSEVQIPTIDPRTCSVPPAGQAAGPNDLTCGAPPSG